MFPPTSALSRKRHQGGGSVTGPFSRVRDRQSGPAQPTYVVDLPGGHGKVPVGPSWIDGDGRIADPEGESHAYPPESGNR